MTTFHPCFLIPCFNHGATLEGVVDALLPYRYPVIIVDDGSNEETKAFLALQAQRENVSVITLPENQAKVGLLLPAFMKRFEEASPMRFKSTLMVSMIWAHYRI